MFNITTDIQPRTTFRRHPSDFMRHLKETRRPRILTVNGKAEAVILDAESDQRLLDIAAHADAREGTRQGLEDLANGLGRPGRAVFDELRADCGIPRDVLPRARRDVRALYEDIGAHDSAQAREWFNAWTP